MTTGSKPLAQQQGRWTDGMCVTACGCVNMGISVWDKRGCKVILYITRVPAVLHNTHTIQAQLLLSKCALAFLSSAPDFLTAFLSVMSALRRVSRTLKYLA